MAGIDCSIKGYKKLVDDLKKTQQKAEKDMRGVLKDVRKAATVQIATDISEKYNVKKSEITAGKIVSAKATQKAGNVEIVYKGRLLTPTHFKGYSPKKPGQLSEKRAVIPGQGINFKGTPGQVATVRTRKKYKVKTEIKKGRKITFSQDSFVAPAAAGSQTYIPFQRTAGGVEAIKTLSVPQMITNDEVAENILEHIGTAVGEGLEKRASKW